MSKVLAVILEAVAAFLRGLFADRRADRAREDLGRVRGALETDAVIDAKERAQHEVDRADRGGARDVLERLRQRLEADRGGEGPPGGDGGRARPDLPDADR